MRSAAMVGVVLVAGCHGGAGPAPAVSGRDGALALARARVVPDPVQARFSLGLELGTRKLPRTGGALILDRPRGHLAVLGPLGGPLATLQTDGTGAAVALARDKRHLLADRADDVLRTNTHGAVGIDALLGVLVGDLPLDDAAVRSERPVTGADGADGGVQVVLDGPEGTAIAAILDAERGTPRSVTALDAEGQAVFDATYDPFEPLDGDPAVWVPTGVVLRLPTLDVTADLDYRGWRVPEPGSPALADEVFGLAPPDGFVTMPLEEAAIVLFAGLLPALDAPSE